MSTPIILDASALLAIALREPGDDVVVKFIDSAVGNCFIHAINAFEVAYKLMAKDVTEAEAWDAAAFGGAVKVDDAGDYVGKRAARLKIANPSLSLGDCFCIALAEDLEGRVLTSDGGFDKAKTTAEIVMIR